MLVGHDRRSIGAAGEVARLIEEAPHRLGEVMVAISDEDPVVRMRASDAVEKATRTHPELLAPFSSELLGPLADIDQQEVRWHVLMMLPRLNLTEEERIRAWAVAEHSLSHPSQIVECEALTAMFKLSRCDPARREAFEVVSGRLMHSGSASVRARIRRLRSLGPLH